MNSNFNPLVPNQKSYLLKLCLFILFDDEKQVTLNFTLIDKYFKVLWDNDSILKSNSVKYIQQGTKLGQVKP